MKITKLVLLLLAAIGAGCTTVPPGPLVSMSDLSNCFDANYDMERGLFTIKNDAGKAVNQQCLLTVGPRGDVAPASRLTAGSYTIYLADGGGGGAGGTLQSSGGSAAALPFGLERGAGGTMQRSGGGGGGGAGSKEKQETVNLTEGMYKLTIGAGGPGGTVCMPNLGFGGGPGWVGSPSNMVRIATGEVVIGTPGADKYARPTRRQNERMAGKMDAHGGSGPGQTSGGHGSAPETMAKVEVQAQPGASKLASGPLAIGSAVGGAPGEDDKRSGSGGGGGGATSVGQGGGGGGESPGRAQIAPERGSLGSGGGGGEGSMSECDPGARGGHGFIALRPK